MEYIWKEVEKISNIESSITAEPLIYNLPNMTENEPYKVVGWNIDWTPLYGELENGEYEFTFLGNVVPIYIHFVIDENGNAQNVDVGRY